MGPKLIPSCQVCSQPSKYRCSACPVRYCSVACYKKHKPTTEAQRAPAPSLGDPEDHRSTRGEAGRSERAGGGGPEQVTSTAIVSSSSPELARYSASDGKAQAKAEVSPLRALTSLNWPPEPDASVFMDPLTRDDPKPLRHFELERIATSPSLRDLLAEPALVTILSALDALPTPNARHAALARVLGVDSQSLAKPAASALMDRSGSPPPLDALLGDIGNAPAGRDDWGADGWWLGPGPGAGVSNGDGRTQRVWIGPEERRLMRLWAGVVVQAIDGGDGSWGQGGLQWEV